MSERVLAIIPCLNEENYLEYPLRSLIAAREQDILAQTR